MSEFYQARVHDWMLACFGEVIASDKTERNHRFIEEALELAQSLGCTRDECHQLVDYVFDRPIGEPHQELGGVAVTMAALATASGLDVVQAAEDELQRCRDKTEKIRAKQKAKPRFSPLPVALNRIDGGAKRWLAVSVGGDHVKLISVPGSLGPDVFVKLEDYLATRRELLETPHGAAIQELKNIADAKRFNKQYFDDAEAFAAWAQNRAHFTLSKIGKRYVRSGIHCDSCDRPSCAGIQDHGAWPRREPSPEWVQHARMEGRAEFLNTLMEMNPEEFANEYIGEHSNGEAGDYDQHWEQHKLAALFEVNESERSLIDRLQATYWEQQAAIDQLEQKQADADIES